MSLNFVSNLQQVLSEFNVECFTKLTSVSVKVDTITNHQDFDYYDYDSLTRKTKKIQHLNNQVETQIGLKFTNKNGISIYLSNLVNTDIPEAWKNLQNAIQNKENEAIIDSFITMKKEKFALKTDYDKTLFIQMPIWVEEVEQYYKKEQLLTNIIAGLTQPLLIMGQSDYNSFFLRKMDNNSPCLLMVEKEQFYNNKETKLFVNSQYLFQERNKLKQSIDEIAVNKLKQNKLNQTINPLHIQHFLQPSDDGTNLSCIVYFELI